MSEQSFAASPGTTGAKRQLIFSLICTVLLAYLYVGWSRSSWIIAVDHAAFDLFSKMTRRSWAVDTMIVQIFRTHTAKIFPLLVCIVWLAFERRRRGQDNAFFGQMILGSLAAMTVSRLIQNFSPHRPRPLHSSELGYQLPFGIDTTVLEGWSSFPSDTTALAFSIAASIFIVSRRLGMVAFLWAATVVAFPRSYAGLHYPSDLLGGALIGLIATFGLAPLILRPIASRSSLVVDTKWQPFLWAAAFLYMFQLATMFDDIRAYGSFVKTVLQP